MPLLPTCLAEIRGASTHAVRAAEQRQLQLTKPAGSMGALERLGSRLAGSQERYSAWRLGAGAAAGAGFGVRSRVITNTTSTPATVASSSDSVSIGA